MAAGDIREGDPIHTALHAILGCAGAAASSQSCSAGALGGAASSALAGLFNESSPNETSEEREAKRNIITSLVTGIAAATGSSGASAASNAAVANVDNNWLATQQIVQASKELAAAPSYLDQLRVIAKWAGISVRQDFISGNGLLSGLTNGLAESGLTSLDSTVRLLAHPDESFAAMKAFVESTSGRQILGAASDALSLQLTKISTALQEGGDANAKQLGEAKGQAVSIVVSALAGGQTNAAKAATELSRMGIDLSSNSIKTAAASYKASSLEKKLAKLENTGRDLDVPDAPAAEKPPLPSYYREDSSAGSMFVKTEGLPDGYRRVINTRTRNVEVVSPEGVFYVVMPGGGLKPKDGGNLAQLVKAEVEIGAKATSIEFLPKVTRDSAGQIEANITQGSAIKTLESNGYKRQFLRMAQLLC